MTHGPWRDRTLSRRGLLKAAAGATVGGAALAVAACSDGDGGAAATETVLSGNPAVVGPVEQQRQRRVGTGLTGYDPSKAFDGYTLFATLQGTKAYVVDMMGEVVNTWTLTTDPRERSVFSVQLLETGNLFAAMHQQEENAPPFVFKGGVLMEVDWDGNVIWQFEDEDQHHDARVLPNGNLLILRAEALPAELEARPRGPARRTGLWNVD